MGVLQALKKSVMSETPTESIFSQTPALIPRAGWRCRECYAWRCLCFMCHRAMPTAQWCCQCCRQQLARGRKGKIRASQLLGPVCVGREVVLVAVPWETGDPLGTWTECVVRTHFSPTSFCVFPFKCPPFHPAAPPHISACIWLKWCCFERLPPNP